MCTYNSAFFTKWVAIFLTVNFLIFSFLYSQEKKVVWVHGLNGHTDGGKKSIWAHRYASEFQTERKLSSLVTDYKETYKSGVSNYAKEIVKQSGTQTKGIAIGHSMGGMALRDIDVNHPNEKYLDGIITVGSPLKGARVADPYYPNTFLSNTYYQLLRPLVSGVFVVGFHAPPEIGAFVNSLNIYFAYESLFSASMDLTVGIGQSIFSPIERATTDDLFENSTYTQKFNSTTTSTPKIHIYGNETTPVSWNTLYSMNVVPTPSTINVLSWIYLGAGLAATGMAFGHPKFAYVAYESYQAHHYFKNGGNGDAQYHTDVLNAYRWDTKKWSFWRLAKVWNCLTENRYESSWKCSKWGWFSWLCKAVSYVVSIVTCFWNVFWELVTGEYQELTLLPSDGIVPISSQIGEGQAWSRNAITIKAQGVNHLQMGNHDEMTKIFNERIWNGGRINGVEDRGDLFYAARR